MISSQKIPQLSLPNKILNLLLQIIAFICVMPVISMEVAIFVLIALIEISLHFFWPLQEWVILNLYKHLIKWNIQGHVMLTPSCYLYPSSLMSGPSLDEGLIQDGIGGLLPFTLLSSSSWQ